MKIIVIDTNVFVSAYLKGGKPLEIFQTLRIYQSVSVISTELIVEHTKVLNRQKFAPHFAAK